MVRGHTSASLGIAAVGFPMRTSRRGTGRIRSTSAGSIGLHHDRDDNTLGSKRQRPVPSRLRVFAASREPRAIGRRCAGELTRRREAAKREGRIRRQSAGLLGRDRGWDAACNRKYCNARLLRVFAASREPPILADAAKASSRGGAKARRGKARIRSSRRDCWDFIAAGMQRAIGSTAAPDCFACLRLRVSPRHLADVAQASSREGAKPRRGKAG